MKSARLPYSLLVPLLALIACSVVILYPALNLYDHLRMFPVSNGNVYVSNGMFQTVVPRNHLFAWSFSITTLAPRWNIMAANLPGYILASLLSSLSGVFLTWEKRLVIVPLLCIPAWWFIGYGIDGLVGIRTLRWRSMLAGSLLFSAFLTMALGFRFCWSAQDRASMTVPLWSIFIWAIAFAIVPLAWLRQRLLLSSESPQSKTAQP